MSNVKDIVLLDLFSGIGGFSLGLSQAGFNIKEHYFSEIDKHAIAVYQHQFKNSKYVGSVTDISELPKRPNIITFGSPCQGYSLAGQRRGTEDERSGLIAQAIALVAKEKPDLFIWENVKGAYSSNNGADFWAIIAAFANLDGYRLEQQLLNTAWVLPQNRERIYLVGHLATSDRSYGEVFPFGEELSRSFQGAKQTANTFTAGGNSGGKHSSMTLIKSKEDDLKFIGGLNEPKRGKGDNSRDYSQQDRVYSLDESKVSANLCSSYNSKYAYTAETLHGNGVDNTIRSGGRGSLTKKHNWDIVKVKSATKQGFEEATEGDSINLSHPESKTRRGRIGKEVSQTLDTSCNQGVLLPRIGAIRGRRIENPKSRQSGLPTKQMLEISEHDKTNTLTSVQKDNVVLENYRIRRLTEIECARLQGFPDNWNQQGVFDGVVKEISSTQRYKQYGNAVTTKMVKKIGERLLNNKKQ